MRAENARLGVETNEGRPRSAIGIKAPIKSHRSISGARPALSEPAWKRPAGPRMGSSSQAGDSQLNRSNFWEAPKDATFQSAHGRGAGAAHISSVVAASCSAPIIFGQEPLGSPTKSAAILHAAPSPAYKFSAAVASDVTGRSREKPNSLELRPRTGPHPKYGARRKSVNLEVRCRRIGRGSLSGEERQRQSHDGHAHRPDNTLATQSRLL